MSKIGIEIRIDVTKIPKDKLFKGKKGTYLTMTSFVNLDEIDQYGMVVVKKDKDEKNDTPILGNVQIFWADSWDVKKQKPAAQASAPQNDNDFDQDIPF